MPAYKGQKGVTYQISHFQHIRIILEVFLRCVMIAATVLVITLADIIGKANDALFINILDKTSAFTTVRTSSLTSVQVFL